MISHRNGKCGIGNTAENTVLTPHGDRGCDPVVSTDSCTESSDPCCKPKTQITLGVSHASTKIKEKKTKKSLYPFCQLNKVQTS